MKTKIIDDGDRFYVIRYNPEDALDYTILAECDTKEKAEKALALA
mgnify:CR=1 FL=1